MMPMHARYDLCLPCEVAGAAKNMLSAPSALKPNEVVMMKRELRAGLPKKRCGHDDLQVLMAIDPDAAFALWQLPQNDEGRRSRNCDNFHTNAPKV